jgi:hypothetical protein
VTRKFFLLALLSLALAIVSVFAFQKGKEREDPRIRSVQGSVEDETGKLIEGAVVRLKDKKSLQVRSFITQLEGAYYFNGLSTDVNYELRAEYHGSASATKALSVYDSRKKAVINLKLEPKK